MGRSGGEMAATATAMMARRHNTHRVLHARSWSLSIWVVYSTVGV